MFAPCPHCGYLIALIATRDRTTLECPRCHNLVEPATTVPPVRSVPPPAKRNAPTIAAPGTSSPTTEAATSTHALDVMQADAVASDGAAAGDAAAAMTMDDDAPAQPTAAAPPVASSRSSTDAIAPTGDESDAAIPGDAVVTAPEKPASPAEPADAGAAPAPVQPVTTGAPTPDRATRRTRRGTSPSFVRATSTEAVQRPRRWPAVVGCLALAMLLASQLLLAQRDALARNARWRPVIASLCGTGLCVLPVWHEPAAFTMLGRNVVPVAGTRDLIVTARFRNDAAWSQAWPHLQLQLSDAQGRPIAARVFAPRDYAGDAARRPIAPRQGVDARLRVREPEPATVAFAFDFR